MYDPLRDQDVLIGRLRALHPSLIDLTTGTVGAFLSVLEDPDGYDADYYVPVIDMLESIACRERTAD